MRMDVSFSTHPADASSADGALPQELREHEPALRGYLRRRFPSIDSDDVVQESYLRILRARTVVRIESAKSYFYAVARNTAKSLFQRQRAVPEISENALPPGQTADVIEADRSEAGDRYALVSLAVDALPSRCRAIMRMALIEGLSSVEIADRLNLSEATVRVQLSRGVRKCSDFLREKGIRA